MSNAVGLVFVAALVSLLLWAALGPDLQQASCPAPVRVAGQLVSCTGHATVSLPGGGTAVISASPTPATARRQP